MMIKRSFLAALLLLAACATAPAAPQSAQLMNLTELKEQLEEYHDSGAYERDVAVVAEEARAWIVQRAPQVQRPAIVFDIDETTISNWSRTRANDYGYFTDGPCDRLPRGPCGAHAYEDAGLGDAIAPMLATYQAARETGVAVFFITGRREERRAGTEANLRRVGYTEWTELVLRPATGPHTPAAEYKGPQRARIESMGYTIIANIGDQQSDLDGGHAERTFLVPNPYYRIH
ncbi:HAD family acid phosphatase [Vitreimonas flagellata]|uniref:HAD family acid phosphatase n=1 Tax=Vitreimonas flagellata TaxID=2560861 RepID=UPI001EF8998C|nr:HAD family acid phosphatase [Vitreimonas flagellata]